jgi:hypothetical protein
MAQMVYILLINPQTFLHFSAKAEAFCLRDYSQQGEISPREVMHQKEGWTATTIRDIAKREGNYLVDVSAESLENYNYWHEYTIKLNKQYLQLSAVQTSRYPLAFVSYSTKEKVYGMQVKQHLEEYGIECFLAHEDIEISEEWKERILKELLRCDIFVPLISKSFRESEWAPQEVGVVIGRKDVTIVPISIDDTNPFGFISHLQGKRISDKGISEDLIISPLIKKIPYKIIPGIIHKAESVGGWRRAEALIKLLLPHFALLNEEQLDQFVNACINNHEIWSAHLCRSEYLPQLLEIHRTRIEPNNSALWSTKLTMRENGAFPRRELRKLSRQREG